MGRLFRRKDTGTAVGVNPMQHGAQIDFIRFAGRQKIGIEFDHIVLNRRRTSRKSDGVDAFGRKKNDSALRAGGYDIVKGNFDFAFADVEKFYIIMPVRRNRQEIAGAVRKKCLIGGSNWIDVFV